MNRQILREAAPIAVALAMVLLFGLFLLLATQVRNVLAVLFLGIVVGVALKPVVETMGRFHFPRVLSVLLLYAILAVALGGIVYIAGREVTRLDLQIDELRASYNQLIEGTSLPPAADVEAGLREFGGGALGGVIDRAVSFVLGVFYIFTVLFTALLFTVTEDRMKAQFLSLWQEGQRGRVEDILSQLARRLRGFLIGEFVAMLAIGTVTYIGLMVLGIKLPVLLAFTAFLFEILPLIGPWIAYIPALLVALTDGFWPAVQVSILYLLIQGFENYIVTPLVHGHESEMPALLILMALLIGSGLMGVLGALISLPIAVILHTLYFEVVVPWNEKRLERSTAPAATQPQ